MKPFAVIGAGGLTQDQRLEAMSKLKQYQCRVLISTDLVRHTHRLIQNTFAWENANSVGIVWTCIMSADLTASLVYHKTIFYWTESLNYTQKKPTLTTQYSLH